MATSKGWLMERTLFSPSMLEAFRACKRAYFLAFLRDGAERARSRDANVCKRFILKGLAEINRGKLTGVPQIQKFMGQYWPLDRIKSEPGKDTATRAFLFAYKTLIRYAANPYMPEGAELAGVNIKVRSRIQAERIYLEDVFDMVLWHPREKRLELVIFHLKPAREEDAAWPSASTLVRQNLAERLRVRFPFETLTLTLLRTSPQETKVSSRELPESMYRLHWPDIVKNLDEMQELSKLPELPAHPQEDCQYCHALERLMVRETPESTDSTQNGYPLSA